MISHLKPRTQPRCYRGHLVEGDNAYVIPATGYIACRQCRRIAANECYASRRAREMREEKTP